METVIFLDIDGVFDSQADHGRFRELAASQSIVDIRKEFNTNYNNKYRKISVLINKKRLSLLHRLIIENNVDKVVIVSSMAITKPLETIAAYLELPSKLLSVGYHCSGGLERGDGVLQYVKDNDISRWCVIDDAGGNCYTFPTVNVNGRLGLTWRDIKQARSFLMHPLSTVNCESSNIYS